MSPLDRARAELADRVGSFPLVSPAAPQMRPWPFADLTDAQQRERALIEIALRNGSLRGLPTVFGELAA